MRTKWEILIIMMAIFYVIVFLDYESIVNSTALLLGILTPQALFLKPQGEQYKY